MFKGLAVSTNIIVRKNFIHGKPELFHAVDQDAIHVEKGSKSWCSHVFLYRSQISKLCYSWIR